MARNSDWFLFNKIFESYDKLKFQQEPCEWLIIHAHIGVRERVLDVAGGKKGISPIIEKLCCREHTLRFQEMALIEILDLSPFLSLVTNP